MVRYVFADTPLTFNNVKDANPQVIGEELERIRVAHRGLLRPTAVVVAANSPTSPIHQHFEWDDPTAAHKYRLDQARTLIRCIAVDMDDVLDEKPRAFYSVQGDDGQAYRALDEVRNSHDLQYALVKQALSEAESWVRRYNDIRELCELVDSFELVLRKARESVQPRKQPRGDEDRQST